MVLPTYTCWGRACSATCVCGILLAWPWKACASARPNTGAVLTLALPLQPCLSWPGWLSRSTRLCHRRSHVSLQCAVLNVQQTVMLPSCRFCPIPKCVNTWLTRNACRGHSPTSLKHIGATDLNASQTYLYMVFIFYFFFGGGWGGCFVLFGQAILLLTNRPKTVPFTLQGG